VKEEFALTEDVTTPTQSVCVIRNQIETIYVIERHAPGEIAVSLSETLPRSEAGVKRVSASVQ
jgi:hypothetical protein